MKGGGLLTLLCPPEAHPQSCKGGHLHLGAGPGRAFQPPARLSGPMPRAGQTCLEGVWTDVCATAPSRARAGVAVAACLGSTAPSTGTILLQSEPETPGDSPDWELVREQNPALLPTGSLTHTPSPSCTTLHPTLQSLLPVFPLLLLTRQSQPGDRGPGMVRADARLRGE